MNYTLKITLKSDATFGSGEGVAGFIDAEVEYDPKTGLPFLRGRALRGLLVEECANLLYGLKQVNPTRYQDAEKAAKRLFGAPGSRSEDAGALFVGRAELPEKLRQAIRYAIKNDKITPSGALEALTTLRRQTAIREDGAPEKNSLRTQRAILRETEFVALLTLQGDANAFEEALLAACARSLRRAGTGRNRGRGRLETKLFKTEAEVLTEIAPDALLEVQP